MWWVISSIGEIQSDIQLIRANQMQLISPSGEIVPSPGNAFARQELKEEMLEHIHDLKVRVKLLEERAGLMPTKKVSKKTMACNKPKTHTRPC